VSKVSEVSKVSDGSSVSKVSEVGYKKLLVWKEAHILVLLVYKITKSFPREEIFGLTNQLRRATISIAANIVEGQARSSKKEHLQFYSIANGSLVEVEYYIDLARDLGYIDEHTYAMLHAKRKSVGILLNHFIQAIKNA
jgi:four helix bundle protein